MKVMKLNLVKYIMMTLQLTGKILIKYELIKKNGRKLIVT